MKEPYTGAPGIRGLGARLRRLSLAAKVTVVGALVTAVVVSLAFWALNIETRSSTRVLFTAQLQRQQRTLLQLQRRDLAGMISSAAIITQSPTLRSALLTYRVEGNLSAQPRADLVHTVERELAKLVTRIDADLLIVTDDAGRVFASSMRGGSPPRRGTNLAGMTAVRRAIAPASTADSGELAVFRDGDVSYQVAVYPLILDGYTIGALLLGQRFEKGLIASAQSAFDGRVVVIAGRKVVSGAATAGDIDRLARLLDAHGSDPASVVRIDGKEHIVTHLALGENQAGNDVTMWLLQPLDAAVQALTRPLRRDFLLYGLLAVIVAAVGSAVAARSALRPFHRFVGFMRSGAAAERLGERFPDRDIPVEVRSLNDSYEHLMASIGANQHELRKRTTELTSANAVLTDEVRERQRVEQELRERDEQLRQSQKLEAIGTLAGGIAHDFNNLLTAVTGFTQLAMMNIEADGPVARDLQQVIEAANRAAGLTKQLLAFSRKQVMKPVVLDVGNVIEHVGPMLDRLLGERVTLRVEIGDDLERVLADRGQLEQVIMNLAINGRDAMPRGGMLTLAAKNAEANGTEAARGEGRRVVISVTDTGTGIPAAIRERIFEPFFTTKDSGKGTGLGLSTVYGIVNQSGGTIDVVSTVGRGTTFRVFLPAAIGSVLAEEEQHAAKFPRGTETVLLVEDDALVRTFSRRTLEECGYTVIPAGDPLEALRLAKTCGVDLILSDMMMPHMTGAEFVEKFIAVHPSPVVIFMSGYADESVLYDGMTMASTLLRKPFTPLALAEAVRDALDAFKTVPIEARP